MSKASYSNAYIPPAPVVPVKIAPPGGSPGEVTRTALIDTGADGTFIPTPILEGLELPIVHLTNVRSHLGERLHRVSVHKVDFILFDTIRLPNIEVVSDDWGNNIIIGRNVLNKLQLHLDGPNETTRITE
jgi:predicted aspartyl protease